MNILFFLTPKSEVAYIHDDESLRQVLEKMEYHKYSAVPIISRQGTYVGTITEGDLLWYIKNQLDLNLQEARRILITNVRQLPNDCGPLRSGDSVRGDLRTDLPDPDTGGLSAGGGCAGTVRLWRLQASHR